MRAKAEISVHEARAVLQTFLQHLAEGSGNDAVAYMTEANRLLVDLHCIRMKSCVGYAEVFKNYPSLQANVELHSPAKDIEVFTTSIKNIATVMERSLKLRKTFSADAKCDTASTLNELADMHDLVLKVGGSAEMTQAWERFESAFDMSVGGMKLYEDNLR